MMTEGTPSYLDLDKAGSNPAGCIVLKEDRDKGELTLKTSTDARQRRGMWGSLSSITMAYVIVPESAHFIIKYNHKEEKNKNENNNNRIRLLNLT